MAGPCKASLTRTEEKVRRFYSAIHEQSKWINRKKIQMLDFNPSFVVA